MGTSPERPVTVAVEPRSASDRERLAAALAELAEQDASFDYSIDGESGQTILKGMGELHLDIKVDRLKRIYKIDFIVGDPNGGYYEEVGTAFIYHGSIGVDCNLNGVADGCDIFNGTSDDLNNNGIPDECEECPEDLNNSGVVDIDDLFQVLSAWGTCDDCPEDLDDSGIVDIDDIFAVLAAWGPCT